VIVKTPDVPTEAEEARLAVVGKRAVREGRERFGMEGLSAPYQSNDEQGLPESDTQDMPVTLPTLDVFHRPHASHVSRPEWWIVILVISLMLGLAYSHLDNNGRHQADQRRAEDARMQAEADKP
jgi:hypothetical protein